ncbi:branched-chain-amino-acid transaminase [Oscillochloris sp. ZM17-4]|uniref:branched-chain-amino-acid transaminase n=1 Tax=Oscillochloris sp. ZM17-4 TaxID=2866714 RepID=UPI001C73D849|nr:branched-chain-amino-acid transaminase [Oscillochloris sp. ZM17-4]MBX0331592.1 branched-chain-amino-acid transaminase [Oscillochloris sp. ZM17-4]
MATTDKHQTFSPDFDKAVPSHLWWNGQIVPWESATVHLSSTFWSGVTAIFEGIMSYWNEDDGELYIWQLDAHLRRLLRSQKLMRQASPYSVAELTEAVCELARTLEVRGDSYIFPYCYPQGGGNFESSTGPGPQPVDISITVRPNPSHLGKGWVRTACVSSYTRISDNVMPPRVKNIANYRNSNLAMAEAKFDGYDTALILNAAGKVAEGPGACLMLLRDGVLVTPSGTESILESISRSAAIELARRELGLEVVERPVDRTELYIADEIFMVGTAAEILTIGSVDHYTIGDGAMGPVTRELEQLFHDVVRGKRSEYAHWSTPAGIRAVARG